MNKIYVDGELPDNCKTCQYKSIARCVLSDKNVFDYMVYETSPKECPVKPLSVRLAEERKKVVKEAKKLVIESTCYDTEQEVRNHLYDMSASEVLEILDQIERGE